MNLENLKTAADSQPVLHTERLILSRFEEADLSDILAYAGSSEVAQTVVWQPHKTLEDSRAYLDWINKNFSSLSGKVFYVWAIRQKQDGRAIGSIDLKQPYPHVGQFDYALSHQHWNKGMVTEAARAVMSWAFNNCSELVRFQSYCIANNVGSRRVMEKCGMELEGLRRKSMEIKGKVVDLAYYALVK